MFDATTDFWQTRCTPLGTGNQAGCFRPHVIYNAANNNYVLWVNQYEGSPAAANSLFVFTCTSPTGGCTQQTNPSGLAHASPAVGDFGLFVDTGGTAYITYSNITTREIWIDSLNANYTDSTGTSVDTGNNGEGPAMFVRSGTYYSLVSALCGFCSAGGAVSYRAASSALGTYGSATTLNSNACNGQLRSVDVITAAGHTTYLLSADQWNGLDNESWANLYYQPLSFTSSAINTFSCNATVTVPGVTLAGAYPSPGYVTPAADQTDVQDGVFNDRCDINATTWRLQTFVPTNISLFGIMTPLGINYAFGDTACGSPPPTSSCAVPNGNLEADLVTVNGSNVPTGTLTSYTIPASALQWATQWLMLPFNATVTAGTTYGLLLKGVGTTRGCFSNVVSQGPSNVYSAGTELLSTNSGSTWTADSGFAFMFSTIPTPNQGKGKSGFLN
jgi:hypothetical protein